MRQAFLDKFSKNTKILNMMKIRPVGAEFFYGDRRTHGRSGGQPLFEILPTRLKILRAFIRFVWISEQTAGTKAFQNLSQPYHHCPQGFPPRPNSAETFIKSFWQMHATTAYRQ
jgi:hypothetical protein